MGAPPLDEIVKIQYLKFQKRKETSLMARVGVETYHDLNKSFGEEKARLIVKAIEDVEDLATKKDLLELKVDLIKWNIGTMVAMTGIFGLMLKLFA